MDDIDVWVGEERGGICKFYGSKATKESAQLKWVVCQNFIVTNLTQIEINIFKDFYCIVEIYQMLEIEVQFKFYMRLISIEIE